MPHSAATYRDQLRGFDPAVASALAEALAVAPAGSAAAFDADGTLWPQDIGEQLLKELAAARRLPGTAVADPWSEYLRRVAEDKRGAYVWAVQAMAGLSEVELSGRCRDLAHRWTARIRRPMRALVGCCRQAGLRTFLVSASCRWAVEALAAASGVREADAIGIAVAVEGGKLTDVAIEPVSYADGKLLALSLRSGGLPLYLAAGDSPTGDVPLLEKAQVALAIGAALRDEAGRRGWLSQSFPDEVAS